MANFKLINLEIAIYSTELFVLAIDVIFALYFLSNCVLYKLQLS